MISFTNKKQSFFNVSLITKGFAFMINIVCSAFSKVGGSAERETLKWSFPWQCEYGRLPLIDK